jgi:hypothetical protein
MIGDANGVAPAGMLADTTLCASLFCQVIVSPTLTLPRFWVTNRFWPEGICTVWVAAEAIGAPAVNVTAARTTAAAARPVVSACVAWVAC